MTWIQYRAFLEADDGYRNDGWWEGLAARQDASGEQYRQNDNHPAENVSWYEAVAYCRWLSKRLGTDIRLPTEWEWQQAATGGDKTNTYPWGRDWHSEQCNTNESGLSRTTAVGLYPGGASPLQAYDMVGNVWEWCLDEYGNPKNIAVSGDEHRAVHGGSWESFQRGTHVAARLGYSPNGRYHYFGFRLCCASPTLQTAGHLMAASVAKKAPSALAHYCISVPARFVRRMPTRLRLAGLAVIMCRYCS